MSRYKPGKAQCTRELIINAASRIIREEGIEGVRIKSIMKSVGLTNGGFYLHFNSREEMIVEAFKAAKSALESIAAPDVSLSEVLNIYLSQVHRDAPGEGCAMAAVVCEVGRSNDVIKDVFTKKVLSRLAFFQSILGPTVTSRDMGILMMCASMGALNLSRAVNREIFSDEILSSVSRTLNKLGGITS